MFMDVCVYPSILLEQETRSGVHSIAEGGVWSQQECWMVEYYRGGDRCDTTLHYSTLHYTTLHYTTLHYTTLHYTTLQVNHECSITILIVQPATDVSHEMDSIMPVLYNSIIQ